VEIKEEKVTQTVKTYTFTEDEYHELIYNQRKYGYDKALEYIGFCVGNYKYKVSTLGGITQFIKDLLDYLKNGYRMNNMYDLSFNEWIKKNR
jgi:hypothetical protein